MYCSHSVNPAIIIAIISGLVSFIVVILQIQSREKLEEAKNKFKEDILATKNEFNKDLAHYTNELKWETERRAILLSELRKEQADIYKVFYKKLVLCYSHAHEMTRATLSDDEQRKHDEPFNKAFLDLAKFFELRRIFFSEKVSKLTDDFLQKVRTATSRYLAKDSQSYTPDERRNEWYLAIDTITIDVKKIKEEIEREFRVILGIEELGSNNAVL